MTVNSFCLSEKFTLLSTFMEHLTEDQHVVIYKYGKPKNHCGTLLGVRVLSTKLMHFFLNSRDTSICNVYILCFSLKHFPCDHDASNIFIYLFVYLF